MTGGPHEHGGMNGRYARQMQLPAIGSAGQKRLADASVLVVGAGGLGCPVLSYLAGAGVGRLVLVDHDRVEETNLHRQPLYTTVDIGLAKVEAARRWLAAFNPDVVVEARRERLTPENAGRLTDGVDIVVDAADSFAVTYILSDICHCVAKPLVSASVTGLSGYAGAFCGGGPSYRAVFSDMPTNAVTCATAGVLGSVVAVVGSLQAQIVLHLILGLDPSPLGQLVTFDARSLSFGGFSFTDAGEPSDSIPFIDPTTVLRDDIFVDLRSLSEAPVSPVADAIRLSVEQVDRVASGDLPTGRIVLCCRSGLRAARAAERLAGLGASRLALVAMGD